MNGERRRGFPHGAVGGCAENQAKRTVRPVEPRASVPEGRRPGRSRMEQTSDMGTWRWAAGDKGEEMGSAQEPRE